MNSYHFSLGNTAEGAVGFCATVTAESKEEALARLLEALPAEVEYKTRDLNGAGEYINFYVNPDAITVSDIDEDDEDDELEEDEL